MAKIKNPAQKASRKLSPDNPAVKASKSVEPGQAKAKFNQRDYSQTHGALASPSINQYLTGYDTTDASEYSDKLAKMEPTELYDHAVTVGEVPIDDRERLIGRLRDRFAQVQAANIPRQNVPMNITPEGEVWLKKYMAGGV